LAHAISRNWPLKQLDVRNAFLNGFLLEEVYIKQPPRFFDPLRPNHVCKLHRALNGLKQAPRAWFHHLHSFLLDNGFFNSQSDASLFIRHSSAHSIYLLVYVDDLIITGTHLPAVESFTEHFTPLLTVVKWVILAIF
jgi:hypothetical protein